jgi:hypothetical protein
LLSIAALLSISVIPAVGGGLQFTDQTSSRFPSPGPTEYTNQATIGDLDGDGDLDIVFANGGNFSSPGTPQKARVYINNGSGFFSDQTDARTGGYSGLHRGVELGDCDQDGDLDILLVQDFNNLPGLLINNGTGNFSDQTGTRLPNITLASSRGQFGDVDNDGDLDIFITSGNTTRFSCGQYRLYLNDGDCFYDDATNTNFPLGNVCNNMDAIFGDIDGDFDLDIRTAGTGTNNSRLYINDGNGVYTLDSTSIPADSTCYSYDFGDIDGDGDLDLIGANGGPGSSEFLLENDGFGNFTNISSNIVPNPNQDDNDTKFLDYDNDGDLDLLIARIGGAEKLYRNVGGTFAQTSGVFQQVSDSSLDIVVGDLTGNGAYDVVTAQGESGNFQNRIYINSGPADTLPPNIVSLEQVVDPDNAGPYVVRVAIVDDMTSDRNFFDQGITLNYSVDAGPILNVPMEHSGGQIYRGEIPGQASLSVVEYDVTANDWNHNSSLSSTLDFTIPSCAGLGDCSGNGTCIGTDQCSCDFGWEGADCSTEVVISAGEVPDGTGAGERPIRFRRLGPDLWVMMWDPGCAPNDEDFAIYQGSVGDFASHVPLMCSTGGINFVSFTPDAGDLYYLVVPLSVTREGSYGLDGFDIPRPVSTNACKPQAVEACP